jgi:hypothetical protein
LPPLWESLSVVRGELRLAFIASVE